MELTIFLIIIAFIVIIQAAIPFLLRHTIAFDVRFQRDIQTILPLHPIKKVIQQLSSSSVFFRLSAMHFGQMVTQLPEHKSY